MNSLVIALASFFGFILAYNTYGKWLGSKIFRLNAQTVTPAHELADGVDYVPTKKEVLFGHHFTSIAGTGPIVGPAIAVFWGWLPALLWIVFGSIFIGAVHDFGALVVSMRNRGHSIGEVAGTVLNKRVRLLFLIALFLALMVVIGIFGLVIAVIFKLYPSSVLSIWVEIPLAVAIGVFIHKRGKSLLIPSLAALGILYAAVYIGAYYLPITLPASLGNPVVAWTVILLVYCFIASVLPVWTLLQPRDYINSHQLFLALGMIILGLVVMQPKMVAPAINPTPPADAPPIFPFLFIIIACGAVSGFHSLVSSGTSSKQLQNETEAQFVGYGSMLLEAALAVIVLLACCAGIGQGIYKYDTQKKIYTPVMHQETTTLDQAQDIHASVIPVMETTSPVTGKRAWQRYYGGAWKDMGLGAKVGAFIEGSANMLRGLGIPITMGITIIAVLVASFAATTLDTATRLSRYVIQELGGALHIKPLTGKYTATAVAVISGGALAMLPGPKGPGSGGLILWPLFGATNQILAGLAFLVILFYLLRRNLPYWFAIPPAVFLIIIPAWAMCSQIPGWVQSGQYFLASIAIIVEFLQIWIVFEGLLLWRKLSGARSTAL